MIDRLLYDAVVAENKALRAELDELRMRLGKEEEYRNPILPNYDLYKSDGD